MNKPLTFREFVFVMMTLVIHAALWYTAGWSSGYVKGQGWKAAVAGVECILTRR
jgi:hypothetical protein